jgi:hypothetical protein
MFGKAGKLPRELKHVGSIHHGPYGLAQIVNRAGSAAEPRTVNFYQTKRF